MQQPRNKGGLGKMEIPILADLTKNVSRDYGVLLEDAGISLRYFMLQTHILNNYYYYFDYYLFIYCWLRLHSLCETINSNQLKNYIKS